MKNIAAILLLLLAYSIPAASQNVLPKKIWGVTIDDVDNLSSKVGSLSSHYQSPVVRIVFDEWQPATNYSQAVNAIDSVAYIMGELLDSYYFNQYSKAQWVARVNEYLNAFGNKVDLWEFANEINGEWLGNKDSVIAKIDTAFGILKAANKKTALTLYYNYNCWSNPNNEMFKWTVQNIPARIKSQVDYVLVSYYEDDCNNFQPNWQKVFDSLHTIFPNSKLGIGECGTTNANKKKEYMTRYYSMNITTPGYIGGYFWWYYKQDCVPKTKALWTALDYLIKLHSTTIDIDPGKRTKQLR